MTKAVTRCLKPSVADTEFVCPRQSTSCGPSALRVSAGVGGPLGGALEEADLSRHADGVRRAARLDGGGPQGLRHRLGSEWRSSAERRYQRA